MVLAQVDGGTAAGILTGLATLIGTTILAIRGLRSDKVTAAEKEDAAILAGWSGLNADLRADIARLRAEFEADRRTWAAERAAWAAERADLLTEVAALRARVRELEARV